MAACVVVTQPEDPEPKGQDWLSVAIGGSRPLNSAGGLRRRGHKIKLNGPHNAYELSFFSMTNIGRLRYGEQRLR